MKSLGSGRSMYGDVFDFCISGLESIRPILSCEQQGEGERTIMDGGISDISKVIYKQSWVSVFILKEPVWQDGRLLKGAIILNYVDEVLAILPRLQDMFYIIERRGWCGLNRSLLADIKLVEDPSMYEEAQMLCPHAILLEVGPADFVDHEAFKPIDCDIAYDVIQISCWSFRKRIELLLDAAARLPMVRFLHLGHFENGGMVEEIKYRDKCLDFASRFAPNIAFPFGNCSNNNGLPSGKTEMNSWINSARIGVLTTRIEGINRFKMECFCANRPVLVPADVSSPTKKHINPLTGGFFNPNGEALARAISDALERLCEFAPREYVLRNTGKYLSLGKLRMALKELSERRSSPNRFDEIEWDGRNQSLIWGDAAIALLRLRVEEFCL